MTQSHVDQLMDLFERALAEPPAQRAEFLDQACRDDPALRQELSSLLEAHESASDYFAGLERNLITPAAASVVDAAHEPTEAALLPQLQAALGNSYRILQPLGGGMSRVFLAQETRLGRKVVIKVLPPEMAATASAERFRREIQLAAQLPHPHIVPLLTSDSAGAFLYYTMPFVAGESLRARLARQGPLPIRDAREIWRDVLDALAHAHASGVIHRDIKPGNILLSGRNALVSDFGIARALEAAGGDASETAPGFTVGTPAYMAPEQVTGDRDADHRVDIYAAALVMYEMLEGRLPFSGDTTRELVLARLTHDPSPVTRPDCAHELAALVRRCLARTPSDRPQSADAVLAELETMPVTSGESTPAESLGDSVLPESTTEPATTTSSHARSVVAPRARHRRRVVAYSVAALALAFASFGARELTRHRASRTPPELTPAPSIAVLPLRNFSTDSADAPLADGMTDELIATLSRAGTLRVIASASVFPFKGQPMDARQIAESLHVPHVLQGGFQKVGRRLRLQVQLVDARDGAPRWSENYDGEFRDILAVQDSVAQAVMRKLDVQPARGRSTTRRYTPSIEAYEWYLRGLHPTLRGAAGTRQAIDYLTRAIAADSNFAAPYARVVHYYIHEAGDVPGKQLESFARAEQAALKAVALDDSSADAHVALGWARMAIGHRRELPAFRDWATAEAEFKQAIALDPRNPAGFDGLSLVYLWTGRPAEQLATALKVLDIAPFSSSAIRRTALALSMNGRCDEAIARLRPLQAVAPAEQVGVVTGQCYAAKQMWNEAIAEFRWAVEGSDARAALAFLAFAQARAGQQDEARRILSDLLAGREYSHGAFGIATVYMGLRDYDEAFNWLDKAVDEHSTRPYLMGPMFEELRRDPRFARVKARLGL